MKIVVRMPNWIGDAVLALPALETLRAAYPAAEIWVAAREWVGGLFAPAHRVRGIVPVPEVKNWRSLLEARKGLGRRGFEIGLLMTNSFASALEFRLAGIPERWGYARDGRRLLLTRAVRANKGPRVPSQRDYYLNLLSGLGLDPVVRDIDLRVSREEGDAADAALVSAGCDRSRPLVILSPGAAYGPAKRWPAARFAALAGRLRSAGAEVALVGGAGDRPAASEISSAAGGRILDFAGRTSLRELAGLISRARAFVTNDTGPMHMANALRIPVVAIFGPTEPLRTGPFQAPSIVLKKDVPCWPCLYRTCPYDHRCMTEIGPDEVFEACRGYLS